MEGLLVCRWVEVDVLGLIGGNRFPCEYREGIRGGFCKGLGAASEGGGADAPQREEVGEEVLRGGVWEELGRAAGQVG